MAQHLLRKVERSDLRPCRRWARQGAVECCQVLRQRHALEAEKKAAKEQKDAVEREERDARKRKRQREGAPVPAPRVAARGTGSYIYVHSTCLGERTAASPTAACW